MNIFKNDRFVLIKEMEYFNKVGMIYEVANITETAVVLRDVKTKVAVGAVNIDDFDKYFVRPEYVKSWTKWWGMVDTAGNNIGFYRTNLKKVQVRNLDGIRAEASCNKHYGDEFDLTFGIHLAYARCEDKKLKKLEAEYENALKHIKSDMIENRNMIKRMLRTLDGDNE